LFFQRFEAETGVSAILAETGETFRKGGGSQAQSRMIKVIKPKHVVSAARNWSFVGFSRIEKMKPMLDWLSRAAELARAITQ
jgi:hypothetical protein